MAKPPGQKPPIIIVKESTRFIPTADDWYPPFFHAFHDENMVKIEPTVDPKHSWRLTDGAPMVQGRLHMQDFLNKKTQERNWFVRISFWGNDDHGIEKDRYFTSFEAAEEIYQSHLEFLTNLAIVQHDQLLDLGFRFA